MYLKLAAAVTSAVLLLPAAAAAQFTLGPGQRIVITEATGAESSCRIAGVSSGCGILRFLGTAPIPPNVVRAHYDQLLPAIGVANTAAASLFTDFQVSGPLETFVTAQISTTFDVDTSLFGAGAYKTAASVVVHVTDITDGAGVPVASHTLFEQERSGDQGLTDVAGAAETQSPRGSTGAFKVMLRRGRTYRLAFEVEVLGEAVIVGKVVTDAAATWTRSIVSIDEDEVDLLGLHDTGIQNALTAHDQAIRSLLATHDADIKSELAEINRKLDEQKGILDEIKRLLLTPQGIREGFPIKR